MKNLKLNTTTTTNKNIYPIGYALRLTQFKQLIKQAKTIKPAPSLAPKLPACQTKPSTEGELLSSAIFFGEKPQGGQTHQIENLNAHLGVLAQAATWTVDDINRLIRKMALSFSVSKNESSFYIKDGIFAGARFDIQCQDRDICLSVQKASPEAFRLLRQHQDYLARHLKNHEINLRDVRFLS